MKVLQFLRHNMLLISTIIAVVLGIVAGMVCRMLKPSPDAIQLVQLPGELFLRMLKMLMLPLIIASIITGVITYCTVFAVTLGQLGRRGAVVTQFFTAVNIVTCKMIRLVMWYSPLGILFLVMGQIMSTSDMTETGQTLAIYIATELAGLAIHSLVVLPGLYFILTRKNPYAIYLKAIQALLTAFATSSSAATLPVTMQCVEKRMKMDTRISRFILPVGATVNMDGSAVYVAIAPVFIAQYNGISMSIGDVIIVSLTAVLNSIGSAGVPGIGYAVLLLVLNSIGLPDRGISFLVTVDWLIDRFRTAVNVASDCLVVGVFSHYTELPPRDPSETQSEPQQEDQEMLENGLV
ncbi:excitatory amino acid transporter-like [Haliotis rufescens]|uniref:excitatory amino acid transporter-like n=1 Tax=Haliotis rufescens TaxID=6454 RepID=UPI00201F754D|nr:excitatory amino acid transporter-like [Haliotis rufescens]